MASLDEEDSIILSEILSENPLHEEQTFIRRLIYSIKQDLNRLNNELAILTKSILEVVIKLENNLRDRFSLFIIQYKEHYTKFSTQIIATTAFILTELKAIRNDNILILKNQEIFPLINNKITQLNRSFLDELNYKIDNLRLNLERKIDEKFDRLITAIESNK